MRRRRAWRAPQGTPPVISCDAPGAKTSDGSSVRAGKWTFLRLFNRIAQRHRAERPGYDDRIREPRSHVRSVGSHEDHGYRLTRTDGEYGVGSSTFDQIVIGDDEFRTARSGCRDWVLNGVCILAGREAALSDPAAFAFASGLALFWTGGAAATAEKSQAIANESAMRSFRTVASSSCPAGRQMEEIASPAYPHVHLNGCSDHCRPEGSANRPLPAGPSQSMHRPPFRSPAIVRHESVTRP